MADLIKSLFSLEGKVAAVTGAGGHLCSEMAFGLARAGCKVAVMDIRLSKAQSVVDAINEEMEMLPSLLRSTHQIKFLSPTVLTQLWIHLAV